MKRECLASSFLGALFVMGCLPGDIRPEPAHVFITAEPGAASVDGFTTDDGWTIHFERLIVGLGNISLEGEGCNEYSGSGYDRLFDFAVPQGAQKLGEAYGLGTCDIEFRLRSPSDEALLQQGVSASDLEFMREVDLGSFEGVEIPTNLPFDAPIPRTAVYARGTATQGDVVKRFDWRFMVRRYELSNCENVMDTSMTSRVNLKGGEDRRFAITLQGEELFREGIEPADLRRFDRFADADADADGNITLMELAEVAAPVVEVPDVDMDDDDDDELLPRLPGWAGFMTDHLLPRLAYLDGQRCQIRPDEPRRPGGGLF